MDYLVFFTTTAAFWVPNAVMKALQLTIQQSGQLCQSPLPSEFQDATQAYIRAPELGVDGRDRLGNDRRGEEVLTVEGVERYDNPERIKEHEVYPFVHPVTSI